jgi:FixJ family two-component response regulator
MQSKVKALGAKEFIRKPIKADILQDYLRQYGLL